MFEEDKLLITYYEWEEKISVFKRSSMKKIKLLVPKIIWENAYDFLKLQSEGSFTIAKAQEIVTTYNKNYNQWVDCFTPSEVII